MEILITISLVTSTVVLWRINQFGVAFLLATTTAFTIWAWIANIATHPLVPWTQHYVSASLGVSAACFLVLWCIREVFQRVRKKS